MQSFQTLVLSKSQKGQQETFLTISKFIVSFGVDY